MKIWMCLLATLLLSSCANLTSKFRSSSESTSVAGKKTSSARAESTAGEPKEAEAAKAGIVVGAKEMATLERMTKAIEVFVHKGEKKEFTQLCKDRRFDCYVGEKLFPANRKKIGRKTPPYALGSKMGLQGETRVQARYEFYP